MRWLLAIAHGSEAPLGALDPLGTDRLADIQELCFAAHVERAGLPAVERSYCWRPDSGEVAAKIDGRSVLFRFGAPSSAEERAADAAFTEDSFWLAPQMHLRWSQSTLSVQDGGEVALPMGGGAAHKLSVSYPSESGGYSPGDTYDLYLDPRGLLLAFTYRGSTAAKGHLTASFTGYIRRGPLTIATERRSSDGTLRISFSEISVSLREDLLWVSPLANSLEEPPIIEIDARRCRLRSVDVPLGGKPKIEPAGTSDAGHSGPGPFEEAFLVRSGARSETMRYSPRTLTLERPASAAVVGLERCAVASLPPEGLDALLEGSTQRERSLLLTLGLEAWLPIRGALVEAPIRKMAASCARSGDCSALVALARAK